MGRKAELVCGDVLSIKKSDVKSKYPKVPLPQRGSKIRE
jgi:hypothetical protein